MTTNRLRILVVDDEPSIVDSVSTALRYEGFEVDTATTGRAALAAAQEGTPDLVILDVMLPGLDGLEICCRMRDEGLHAPVLLLTARGAVEDRVAGLNAGADDYLVKPFAMAELLARVAALLRRRDRGLDAAPTLQVGDLTLDLLRHEARRAGRVIDLTAKEFALLEYLMRHPGQALTRTQITDQVWRYDLDALSNVVDIYIHYLRDKIDRGFPRPLIKTVRGVGYKIEG